MKNIIRKIIKAILHFLIIVVYRVKITGKENIPKTGSYIICGNHIHALDAAFVVLCAKRKIVFMVKSELYKSAFMRFLGNTFDMIPVKRGAKDLEAMKKSLKVLKTGGILGIYPEGTRKGMEKQEKLKTGAAFLALRSNTKVIPVGIKGNFKPFSRVIVNYGVPLDFSEYQSSKPEKEILEKVTNEIMDHVIKLTNM